jgi:hypothetical protein
MNEIKKYTAADFARYHAGTMPASEMHALEKASLEDPFLEDALEGYAVTPTPAADLGVLHERLSNAVSAKKVFPLSPKASWWRIAALLIIMAGAGYLFFLVNNNVSRQNNLAKNESIAVVHTDTTAPAFKSDTAIAVTALPAAGLTSSAVAPVKVIVPQASVSSWSHTQAGTYAYTPAQPTQQLAEASVPAAPQNAATADESAARYDVAQNTQRDFYSNTQSNKTANDFARNNNALNNAGYNNTFNSPVKDQNGNAVSNANITDRKVNAEPASDDQGKFKLKVADTTMFAKADVPGYKSNAAGMKKAAPAKRTPETDSVTLDAVTITTQLGQRKQAPNLSAASATIVSKEIVSLPVKKDVDKNAGIELRGRTSMPASGQTAEEKIVFDKYIKDNMQPVYNREGKRMAGEVLLSFFVSRKGRPKDIKVAMSLCPPCEAQAIQLLENGPNWSGKKNEEKTVIIRF